jgi:hypothetical protein
MVAWFPASAIMQQRRALSSTARQLSALQAQDRALSAEQKRLASPAEIGRIAREQFGLVLPGQQSYQVLPPSDAAAPGNAQTPYAGDPGAQKPVSPSASAVLPPQPTTGTSQPGGSAGTSSSTPASGGAKSTVPNDPGIFERIARTLEFWQ